MVQIRQQKGMTAVGWLVVLALVAFFALLAIKLLPIYLNGYKVVQSVKSLKSDNNAFGKPPLELKKMILKRIDINGIYNFDPQDISIRRVNNNHVVEVDYEVKESMFGNLSVVVQFDAKVEVPAQ